MNKGQNIAVWGLIVLGSLAFIAAGIGKLSGVEMLHASFAAMGLPAWFGYFIGAAEVAGGLGLYWRKTSAWAAAGLFIIMLGAIYFHVVYQPSAIPAVVLALITAVIFYNRRRDALFIGEQKQLVN